MLYHVMIRVLPNVKRAFIWQGMKLIWVPVKNVRIRMSIVSSVRVQRCAPSATPISFMLVRMEDARAVVESTRHIINKQKDATAKLITIGRLTDARSATKPYRTVSSV